MLEKYQTPQTQIQNTAMLYTPELCNLIVSKQHAVVCRK